MQKTPLDTKRLTLTIEYGLSEPLLQATAIERLHSKERGRACCLKP